LGAGVVFQRANDVHVGLQGLLLFAIPNAAGLALVVFSRRSWPEPLTADGNRWRFF